MASAHDPRSLEALLILTLLEAKIDLLAFPGNQQLHLGSQPFLIQLKIPHNLKILPAERALTLALRFHPLFCDYQTPSK